MTISAFKTCKVWFSLNPSMCNSGFYRIPGSNILFSLNIFSSLLIFSDSSFSKEFLLSFSLFSLLPSSQPIPSFYNGVFWASRGTIGSPVLLFCEQSMSCPCCLGKSLFRFFSFFPSLSSDSFESFWLAIFFGECWGMPFSASPLLAPSTFPFLSYLGGILFYFFKNRLLSFFFPVLVPRGLFCLCHEKSLAFFFTFVFLVFFFFSVFFLSSCPSLPFFFVPEGIRAYWWFLRILASYTLPWSSLFFSLDASLFWASGSSGPFFYSLMGLLYNYFGLSLNFPSELGLTYSFWAYFTMIFFGPQQPSKGIWSVPYRYSPQDLLCFYFVGFV